MKHVLAFLSARKDGESSFHNCESFVKLVQACFLVPGKIAKAVFITVEGLSNACRPVYVPGRSDN